MYCVPFWDSNKILNYNKYDFYLKLSRGFGTYFNYNSRNDRKRTFGHVRKTKIQITFP